MKNILKFGIASSITVKLLRHKKRILRSISEITHVNNKGHLRLPMDTEEKLAFENKFLPFLSDFLEGRKKDLVISAGDKKYLHSTKHG